MKQSYGVSSMMQMEHEHGDTKDPYCDAPEQQVVNLPHYHAFILLGKEQLFASHLTQLHCEVHKYQFVMKVALPEQVQSAFVAEREAHPSDSYFLANTMEDKKVGNTCDDPMTLPELAGRLRTSFVGNVFRGIPPIVPPGTEYTHWPWEGVRPVFANIRVSIERMVHFRPFSATMNYPGTLTYLLFGAGHEAHMVHYQTKMPDFDHMASLKAAPPWLEDAMLAAGVVVDLPDIPRTEEKDAAVRCTKPFENGSIIQVRYRAAEPRRAVTIDHTYWFCTRVCNKPDPCKLYESCGSRTPPS